MSCVLTVSEEAADELLFCGLAEKMSNSSHFFVGGSSARSSGCASTKLTAGIAVTAAAFPELVADVPCTVGV
jgi:hypothetical protein